MRKIYSLVLMATMLLIGTNAWAKDFNGTSAQLQDSIAAIIDGSVQDSIITLTENVYFGVNAQTIHIGTKNMNDPVKSVVIDLNGHNITWNSNEADGRTMFALYHGELIFKNSAEQEANIQLTGKANDDATIVAVYGTYKSSRWNDDGTALSADSINTRDKGWYSHLVIGKGVKLYAEDGCEGAGIYCGTFYKVFGKYYDKSTKTLKSDITYGTDVIGEYGFAHGVRIDVEGKIDIRGREKDPNNDDDKGGKAYGIKTNGYLQSPLSCKNPNTNRCNVEGDYLCNYADRNLAIASAPVDGNGIKITHKLDTLDVPFIWLHPGSEVSVREDGNKVTALYAAGYAKWLCQGYCAGKTGMYVSSGTLDLLDAHIKSTADDWQSPTSAGSANGGGSGVVLNSRDGGYAGDIEFTVAGDTKIESIAGYGIEEIVNTTEVANPAADPENPEYDENAPETIQVTKVANITIEGGTIIGGDEGAIVVSTSTMAAAKENENVEVTVYGGQIEGVTQAGTGDLDDLIPNTTNYHTTEVTVTDPETGSEKTIIVVSKGGEPAIADPEHPEVPTTWEFIAAHQGVNNSYKWTAQETNQQITSGTIKLNELQINSGTAGHLQELIIKNNAALEVNRLIMNDYARIIVEAGGKLIVKGTQGITSPKAENILLKASETEQAIFLVHPNVTSNRHPNATVEFISNSITDGDVYTKQRFGIPTYEKLENITTKYNNEDVRTVLSKFIYGDNEWVDFGWINFTTKTPNLDQMASPFDYYQMQNNAPHNGTVVTMYGQLYGNSSPALEIRENSWNGYANSYMAPINAQALIDLIPGSADKSFHIYTPNDDERKKGSWAPVSNLDLEDIKPMQAFLLSNPNDAAAVTVDYWDAVYTPITGEAKPTPNAAPVRRSALSNITKAKMIVRGEDGMDRVVLAQGDQFSAAFDNSYDCRKYMNEGINLYVSADEKMGIFATDNLENTYVGFQSVNGGTYTIEFTDVQGEGLTLIDHETGAQVLMVEGNTYEFSAAAHATNDYRFEVVTTAKIATGIENTEAVKSAKGIYTITGQYLGEMNVWNSLPAGVYVVNGEKRVK